MYTHKIVAADKQEDAAGKPFINVRFDLLKEGNLLGTFQEGFQVTATADEIKATLSKKCEALQADEEFQAILAGRAAEEAQVQATIDALKA